MRRENIPQSWSICVNVYLLKYLASAQLFIEWIFSAGVGAPTELAAEVVENASIRVSWNASDSGATGYRIYYRNKDDEGRVINLDKVDVDASVTEHNITHGLTAGHRYVITVRALSRHLPSPVVGPRTVTIGKSTWPIVVCCWYVVNLKFYCVFQLHPLRLLLWQSPSLPHPSLSIGPSQRERLWTAMS